MNCVSLYSCLCSLLYCTSLLSRTSTFQIMYKRSPRSLMLYQWYVYWLSEVEINLISTFSCINKLRNWSLWWLINCLSVSLIRLLIDQMIDCIWLIDWLIDWLIIDWLIDWFIDWLIDWLIDCIWLICFTRFRFMHLFIITRSAVWLHLWWD